MTHPEFPPGVLKQIEELERLLKDIRPTSPPSGQIGDLLGFQVRQSSAIPPDQLPSIPIRSITQYYQFPLEEELATPRRRDRIWASFRRFLWRLRGR